MVRDINRYKAWAICWSCSDPNRTVLSSKTQGQPIAVFPGKTSKKTIEGALIALHQVLDGSDAESMANRLRRKLIGDRVEWDYLAQNAKIGLGLEVWAQHGEIHYDHTETVLEETRGSGRVTFKATSKWLTRSEYREQLKSGMQD